MKITTGWMPVTQTRRYRIFRDLAVHPEGRSTPELARLLSEVTPWQQALTKAGETLRTGERYGQVVRVGATPGAWQRGPAVIWQLTEDGAALLFTWALDGLRSATTPASIHQCGADGRLATEALVRLYDDEHALP